MIFRDPIICLWIKVILLIPSTSKETNPSFAPQRSYQSYKGLFGANCLWECRLPSRSLSSHVHLFVWLSLNGCGLSLWAPSLLLLLIVWPDTLHDSYCEISWISQETVTWSDVPTALGAKTSLWQEVPFVLCVPRHTLSASWAVWMYVDMRETWEWISPRRLSPFFCFSSSNFYSWFFIRCRFQRSWPLSRLHYQVTG